MPYPNEHACQLRDPGAFQKKNWARTTRKSGGKTYSIIMGRLKGSDKMTEQSYRYKKGAWTASEARKHCKDHKGSFEAAAGGEKQDLTELDHRIEKHYGIFDEH